MSAELPIVYAALILQDEKVEITADKLQTLVKAAGVNVNAAWYSIFAKALEGKDLSEVLGALSAPGAGPATGAAAGGAAAAADAAPAEEAAKEEEESDDDMGFGLFD